MGKYVIDETTLRDIANKIRSYTGSGEEMTPVGMPLEIDAVWEDGKTIGEEVYGEAYEAGRKAEYDAFWNEIQQLVNQKSFVSLFAGRTWTDARFKPPYPITFSGGCNNLFHNTGIRNMCQCIETAGVEVKFEGIEQANSMFSYSRVTHLPTFDFSQAANIQYAFQGASILVSVEKVIVGENTSYASTFANCNALEDITFEGVIGKNIAFSQSSKLTNASVQSIIDHLKDLTGATAQTLTFHADVGAKLTQTQKDAISAKNWTLVY
jgi:hypothetical protein